MPTTKINKSEVKKIAVIDLGTNSARLLLAAVQKGEMSYRQKKIKTTRLGEGVDQNKVLTERAIKDTLRAVKTFYNMVTNEGYDLFKIIGTSALRDVDNQEDLLNEIYAITNCQVDVIDGIEEAKLGYYGVSNSFSFDEKMLVIDIGGGSTELIFGDETVGLVESLNIGAVRMTDRCITEDPPSTQNLEFLKNEIDAVIDDFIFKNKQFSFSKVIGIGGTITTLSGINLKMPVYDSNKIQGSLLTAQKLDDIIQDFIEKPFEIRKGIIGLNPKRSDIIIAGSIILQRLMRKFDFSEIFISDYDNLEGIIFKEFLS